MRVVRVSDSCTTGLASLGQGELWLTRDTLVRLGGVGATGKALRRSARTGLLLGGLGASAAQMRRGRMQRMLERHPSPAAWAAQVANAPSSITVPLASVKAAALSPGVVHVRLDITMTDDERVVLMWMRNDESLALVDRALTDLETHHLDFPADDGLLDAPTAAPSSVAAGDVARTHEVLTPGRAPSPHTTAELRAGCPDGRTVTQQVEPAGGEPFLRITRFEGGDDVGTTMVRQRTGLGGTPLEGPDTERIAWTDLAALATFPADDTSVSREVLDTPLGAIECLRYVVRRSGGAVETYWFDPDRPGLPLRVQMRSGTQLLATVTVVADDRAHASEPGEVEPGE